MTTGTSTISGRRIAIGARYEGMEVVQPTAEHPIRRCTALAASQVALSGDDLREKSGFVAEARDLKTITQGGGDPGFAARLENALAVTELCEALTRVQLCDSNPNVCGH
jgi:hypothetical protein